MSIAIRLAGSKDAAAIAAIYTPFVESNATSSRRRRLPLAEMQRDPAWDAMLSAGLSLIHLQQ